MFSVGDFRGEFAGHFWDGLPFDEEVSSDVGEVEVQSLVHSLSGLDEFSLGQQGIGGNPLALDIDIFERRDSCFDLVGSLDLFIPGNGQEITLVKYLDFC